MATVSTDTAESEALEVGQGYLGEARGKIESERRPKIRRLDELGFRQKRLIRARAGAGTGSKLTCDRVNHQPVPVEVLEGIAGLHGRRYACLVRGQPRPRFEEHYDARRAALRVEPEQYAEEHLRKGRPARGA